MGQITLFGDRVPTSQSPLRYPGGKTRAAPLIRKLLGNADSLCAPFLGGASVELYCAAAGIQVHGADIFEPLIHFWRYALKRPVKLAERAWKHYPLTPDSFRALQKELTCMRPYDQAAAFYVLNRASFSGLTLSGGLSPGMVRFNRTAMQRLADFHAPNLHVELADWRQTLEKHKDKALYLDPPYLLSNERLYGNRGDTHKGFDHAALAYTLRQRDGWILSYNECEEIRRLYDGYTIRIPEWQYSMVNDADSKEILIINM